LFFSAGLYFEKASPSICKSGVVFLVCYTRPVSLTLYRFALYRLHNDNRKSAKKSCCVFYIIPIFASGAEENKEITVL
jgi:hypothetical protein